MRRLIVIALMMAACKSSAPTSASIRCGEGTSNTSITCTSGKPVCRCMGPYAQCECK